MCKYNMGVTCRDEGCKNCGWNPKVAKWRKVQILNDLQEGCDRDIYTLGLKKEFGEA